MELLSASPQIISFYTEQHPDSSPKSLLTEDKSQEFYWELFAEALRRMTYFEKYSDYWAMGEGA